MSTLNKASKRKKYNDMESTAPIVGSGRLPEQKAGFELGLRLEASY